jgi:cathepsin F
MNTKVLIALALLCLVACDRQDVILQQFLKFKQTYNKEYKTIEEFITRFNVFKHNFQRIENMTVNRDSKHMIGITKYSDLTPQEFRNTYLNLRISASDFGKKEFLKSLFEGDAPATWDWRDKGAVGPIKDQGQCGSCWAFSTVGNLEGLHAIKTGKIVQYAEQQLVDCDKVDHGCNGGMMESAFEYIKEAGGIEKESDYKYTAHNDKCKFDKEKAVLQVQDKQVHTNMDETEMASCLVKVAPLAIALNATPLQDYSDGILDLDEDDCDPAELNHGVTLVGYGTEDDQDFWIVKNSWGEDWGEQGYFRIARGKGTCGINAYVSTAILADS